MHDQIHTILDLAVITAWAVAIGVSLRLFIRGLMLVVESRRKFREDLQKELAKGDESEQSGSPPASRSRQ